MRPRPRILRPNGAIFLALCFGWREDFGPKLWLLPSSKRAENRPNWRLCERSLLGLDPSQWKLRTVVSACVMTQAHPVLDLALSINPPEGNGCCLLNVCIESSCLRNCTQLIQRQGKPSKYLGTCITHNGASVSGPEPFGAEIGG